MKPQVGDKIQSTITEEGLTVTRVGVLREVTEGGHYYTKCGRYIGADREEYTTEVLERPRKPLPGVPTMPRIRIFKLDGEVLDPPVEAELDVEGDWILEERVRRRPYVMKYATYQIEEWELVEA